MKAGTSRGALLIEVTHWPSLRDPQGRRLRCSWPSLCARLGRPVVAADKHAVAGLSLATFRGDRRALANVERVYAVGLDVDHELVWDELVGALASVASVVHTTWSSRPEDRRARAFVLLSRPVSAEEYRVVYGWAAERLAARRVYVDRAASDPSRLWFLPSHPEGAEFLHMASHAPPWQLPDRIELPPPPPPPQLALSDAAVGDVTARAAAYLEHVGPAISGSNGGTHTFVVAQKLVLGFGLDDDTAFSLLWRWNATCRPPWTERELRRKIREARARGTMAPGSLRDAPRPER